MLLPFDGPLNLTHTLESGQAFRWQPAEGSHFGVIYGNIVKLRRVPKGIEFFSNPTPEEVFAPVLSDYLRLEDDMPGVYRLLGKDPSLASAIRKYRGLRLLRQEPWECLVCFILSINSSVLQISRNVERLSAEFGPELHLDDHVSHAFPTPEDLASIGEKGLRERRLGFRAPFLAGIAGKVCDGSLDLEALRHMPYPEAKQALLGVHGIGEKVAGCGLLFSLDHLEAFPVDRWVRRAVLDHYFPGKHLTDRLIRSWAAEYFGPYAGYAQQYLFHWKRLHR